MGIQEGKVFLCMDAMLMEILWQLECFLTILVNFVINLHTIIAALKCKSRKKLH